MHGIETDGKNNIFRLTQALRFAGFEVVEYTYEHTSFWDTFSRCKSDNNALGLLNIHQPGDHVIGHSNGGRLIHRAMEIGAEFAQCYLFAPAFGATTAWPKLGAKKINIIFNPRDRAIRLGALVPGHDFGWLGAVGYQGEFDERIHSISDRVSNSVDPNEHSYMFQNPSRLDNWAAYLIKRLAH